jgi:EAL domain-containing protein (putative c-di-GMP-specific phosphodiesterase class I)
MLAFEISESVLMQDTGQIASLLASLRTQGFVLAVDKFGSGHSNLARLRRLPVNALNISPDIVRDIATDPNSATVAKAAIGLAHDFGLRAVAKGVETQAQRDVLRTLDCDEAQGNFFGRPVSAATLESLLRHDAKMAG